MSAAARWHGTDGGYTNHGCRCKPCTVAHAVYQSDYLRRNPRQRALKNARDWEYGHDRVYR